MIKQSLQHRLQQRLSPQQIQLIKLLEIPTSLLEQRIKKEMEENPILEESNDEELVVQEEEENKEKNDEFSMDDYLNEEDTPSYKLNTQNFQKEEITNIPFSVGSSFHEHLRMQMGLRMINDEQKQLAEYIIGNIDEAGYLRRKIESIVDDIAFSQNIHTTDEKMYEVLKIIQNFEPTGVAARNLQECLMLQINEKCEKNPKDENLKMASSILKRLFKEFTKKHYDKIINRLNISEERFKKANKEILKLNPKPGSTFSDGISKMNYHISPDFSLEKIRDELKLSLNSKNAPSLKISRTYSEMIQTYKYNKNKKNKREKEAILFVKQKLDSAKWFIDAIKQRQKTLILTMQAIIDYQKKYFLDGDEKNLKPMILKNIADITNLDISTISRVANSKYIQTHFGIFSLKYFFSESMQTDTGEEVSTREIKTILQECINEENKRKPYTDDKLANILQKKGYLIARRTVAKYREQLNLPVARLRKEL